MATQPDIEPDRIEPQAPMEDPVISPPGEAPMPSSPEITPEQPNPIDPGQAPAETPMSQAVEQPDVSIDPAESIEERGEPSDGNFA